MGVQLVRVQGRLPRLEGTGVSVTLNTAIGLFFVGAAIGLLLGLVIHDAFKAWEDWKEPPPPRKPW